MSELNVIGRSVFRKDALGKVTGEARYASDVAMEDLLHAAVLRSPFHHARIIDINVQEAKELAGVVSVITADDVPGSRTFGQLIPDRPVLAFDFVRHKGEPVAMVIGETRLAAQRALEAILVNYEELPAILEPEEALDPNRVKIHPEGNLIVEYNLGRGDMESGFAEADVIVDATFHTPRISPAYLEPEVAIANLQSDGTLVVWVSSQKPFLDQSTISRVLDIPEDRVQVKVATVGGSFGGKTDSGPPALASLAAWVTKRAVLLVNAREESFLAHPKRHPAKMHYKIGAKDDGTLVALSADIILDTGAYAHLGPAVGGTMTELAPGPYQTPNVRINTKVVYTNSPLSGSIRAFGAPQVSFAYESAMDMLAAKLDIDLIELRRKNIWRKNDTTVAGVKLRQAPTLDACLDHAAKAHGQLRQITPSPGRLSGVGVSLSLLSMGLGFHVPDRSTNRIEWLPDGRALQLLGTPDLGQGLITVAAQITAEGLELDFDSIEVATIDTLCSPDGGNTLASRTTLLVGNSILAAAEKAIEALLDYAAIELRVSREVLYYQQGHVFRTDDLETGGHPVSSFTSRAAEEGIVLSGEAEFSFFHPPDTPKHLPEGMPHVMFCYGANVVRVEVDPDFGTVEVKDVVAIHDVGKAINPAAIEGQIEGGVVMGVGYATLENVELKDSGEWVDSYTEYLIPTALDAPTITSVIIEQEEPGGPYGAKGVAEMTVVSVAPAIANAVADATGKRIKSIPIRPEALIND